MKAAVKCPYCGSSKVHKRGNYPKSRYQCVDRKHPEGISTYFYNEGNTLAKVLVFDIETLPGIKRFWRMGEEDWSIDSIIADWRILSWSAKWLFEAKYMSDVLTPKEARNRDDKRIVTSLAKWMHEADILIAHHGEKFDMPKVFSRMLEYDMAPPYPLRMIDTRKESARVFGNTSNKLDWLARMLNLEVKKHTEYSDWVKCEAGDKDALTAMEYYNIYDVFLLEDVYVKLRPWIRHPNMSMYMLLDKDEDACPRCGHEDLLWDNVAFTNASAYKSAVCENCGGIARSAKRVHTTLMRVV